MLPRILERKMRDEGLSLRLAADEMGISHGTLARVLKGKPSRLDTLVRISEWTGMSLASLLGMTDDSEVSVGEAVSAVVEADPNLKEVFLEAYKQLQAGEIDTEDLRDIAAYAAYKLHTTKGPLNEKSSIGTTSPNRRGR